MGTGKGGDNVVVAVRVRPFNDREKGRNAQLIIEMPDGQRTCIRDPNNPSDEKWFTFDHSYWSHDGFKTEKNGYFSPADSRYADQKRVFEDLGKGILENAWAGYNCSLFAYGQTGSGKSYSIVGFKGNKGIVPTFCEELFKDIEAKKENSKKAGSYEVFISMFEIYCEKIRDLLSNKEPPKGGLKVREHPKTGFYVENLSSTPVNSYKEIEAKIDQGTKNRTIAATNMNATSSRAHTIVKLLFVQKSSKSGGGTTTKKSEINLVDLAGSERQRDAGTEGDRMKEGIVINQSLSTLGRVIKALHEQQSSKGKKIQIPYRDSVLTCLLKNALGGNSKTIMIAAISPADINYDETLSTLRFADRAKAIKTNAIVNENQTERLLRELREENERLQKQLKGGGGGTNEEIESLRRQLEQNQKEMSELEKTWQEKVAEEAAKEAEILINGKRLENTKELVQNDRVLFGGNHLYVFNNPTKGGARKDITYEEAQKEIAQGAGINISNDSGKSKADMILEEELISMMPLVYRANAMAVELKRNVKFELVLVSPEMRGLHEGLTEIWVSVHNQAEDTYFMWEKARFMNRYYGMQEMYENKQDGEDWNMPKERDPFYEAPDSKTFLGSAIVFLQPLAYLMDSEETYPIVDVQGNELGELSVMLTPCNPSGKELIGEYVSDPKQTIGKSYGFMVKVQSARGLPRRIEKSSCKYKFFNGKEICTQMLSGSTPSYSHEQIFQFKAISPELSDYLLNSNLCISLWGTQKARQMNVLSAQAGRRRQSMTEPTEKRRPRKKRPSSQAPRAQRDENEAPQTGSEGKTSKPKKKSSSKTRRPKKEAS
uniref:Kinesin-like protein n=1 Tax=Haemonchus contortus TaxID=6289 RepID=A0A7I4YDT7_HAECO